MNIKIKYLEEQLSQKQNQLDLIKASIQEIIAYHSSPLSSISSIINKLYPFIQNTKLDILKIAETLTKFKQFHQQIFQLIHHLPQLYQNAFQKKYKNQYIQIHSLKKENQTLKHQILIHKELIQQYQQKIQTLTNQISINNKNKSLSYLKNIESQQFKYQFKKSEPEYQNPIYYPFAKTQNKQQLETIKVYFDTATDSNKDLSFPYNLGAFNLDSTIRLKPNNNSLNLTKRQKVSRSMTARNSKNLQACFKQTDQYWKNFMKEKQPKGGPTKNNNSNQRFRQKKNRSSIGYSADFLMQANLKNNNFNHVAQSSKFQELKKAFKLEKYTQRNKFR